MMGEVDLLGLEADLVVLEHGQWLAELNLAVSAGFPAALGHCKLNLSELSARTALHRDARLRLELAKRLTALFDGLANVVIGYASANTYVHGGLSTDALSRQNEIDNHYHNSG